MENNGKKTFFDKGEFCKKFLLPGAVILILIFFFCGDKKPDIPDPVPLKAEWYTPETARGEILENTVMPGNCFICHSVQVPDPSVIRPQFAHATVKLEHGANNRCFNCHHIYDRDSLAGDGESKIPFATPEKLCARCHGLIVKDWQEGTHGLRQGGWLIKNGANPVNFTCTECHDPHSPKFKYAIAAPAPVWPKKTIRTTKHDEDPKSAYLIESHQESF
ncbi:MAG: hypothetical protein QM483_03435 [Desulfuromusa sp.]